MTVQTLKSLQLGFSIKDMLIFSGLELATLINVPQKQVIKIYCLWWKCSDNHRWEGGCMLTLNLKQTQRTPQYKFYTTSILTQPWGWTNWSNDVANPKLWWINRLLWWHVENKTSVTTSSMARRLKGIRSKITPSKLSSRHFRRWQVGSCNRF